MKNTSKRWSLQILELKKKVVTFKLDKGADCNVMSANTWIVPLGKITLTCELKGQKYRVEF